MTDNEIIKALECCGDESGNLCSLCPKYKKDADFCAEELHLLSRDLINRQKAEIEGAKLRYEEIKADRDKEHQYAMHYARMCYKAKTEAVKAFAERLKARLLLNLGEKISVVTAGDVDNLVKEMEGE